MATDGVKIIDGDLAHDTYNQIMDLYDSGASIETIMKEVPFEKDDYGPDTDFYHEIFVTAYGLAFWEIDALTDEMHREIKKVIALNAGVKVWTQEVDEREGKKRQKVLEKFLKKISEPNLKVRKRKKYKLITSFYFQPDDVLTFQLSDKYYYATICTTIRQYRGECSYSLAATTYKGKTKPRVEDLESCFIVGRKIGSGFDPNITLVYQPNVDEIWRYSKEDNFFFGLDYDMVAHRDIIGFKDKFEVIGKLKIKESFKKSGAFGYASSFNRFEDKYCDIDKNIKVFGAQKYPVSLLCES